jgi:hypothetical protein
LAGKLDGQVLGAIAPGRLIHVLDENSGVKFLIDTGAAFSCLPHHSSATPSGPSIRGPDGRSISVWGERLLHLQFSGRRFVWKFLLANVSFPILGIDFLTNFDLKVHPAGKCLELTEYGGTVTTVNSCVPDVVPVPAVPVPVGPQADLPAIGVAGLAGASSSPSVPAPPVSKPDPVDNSGRSFTSLTDLLSAYPTVLNAGGNLPPSTHKVLHHIQTSGPPVTAKFRPLPPDKLMAAKKEFAALE